MLYPSLTNSLASLSATLPLRAPPLYDHHRCSVIAQAYRVCFDRAQDVAALAPSLPLPPLLLPGPRPMLTLIMLCARAGWTQLTDIKNACQSPPYGRYARIQPAHRVFAIHWGVAGRARLSALVRQAGCCVLARRCVRRSGREKSRNFSRSLAFGLQTANASQTIWFRFLRSRGESRKWKKQTMLRSRMPTAIEIPLSL